jgi:hypothetical protein
VGNHVFVSYARADKTYVDGLVAYLRGLGVDVWNDADINYGARWTTAIRESIDTCAAFVVVMSLNAAGSRWVEREVLRAQEHGKRIFPLLLSDRPLFAVNELQHEDVRGMRMPSLRWVEGLGVTESRADGTAVNLRSVHAAAKKQQAAKAQQPAADRIPYSPPADQGASTPQNKPSPIRVTSSPTPTEIPAAKEPESTVRRRPSSTRSRSVNFLILTAIVILISILFLFSFYCISIISLGFYASFFPSMSEWQLQTLVGVTGVAGVIMMLVTAYRFNAFDSMVALFTSAAGTGIVIFVFKLLDPKIMVDIGYPSWGWPILFP